MASLQIETHGQAVTLTVTTLGNAVQLYSDAAKSVTVSQPATPKPLDVYYFTEPTTPVVASLLNGSTVVNSDTHTWLAHESRLITPYLPVQVVAAQDDARSTEDTLYAKVVQNLADLTAPATALANLGGAPALTDRASTTSEQLPLSTFTTANPTSGALAYTAPAPTSGTVGKRIGIKALNLTNGVTLAYTGPSGAVTLTWVMAGEGVILRQYSATAWEVESHEYPRSGLDTRFAPLMVDGGTWAALTAVNAGTKVNLPDGTVGYRLTTGTTASAFTRAESALWLRTGAAPLSAPLSFRRRERRRPYQVGQLMAAPPTVGAVASATAITSGVTTSPLTGGGGSSSSPDATAPFLYLGIGPFSMLARYGASFPDYNYVKSTHKTTTNTANPHHSVQFGFDGTQLEIKLRNTGSGGYRIRVDGQLVAAAPTTYTTPTQGWLPLTFAARGPKVITVELYNLPFGGVVVGPNDTVWKPTVRGPRVVIAGDSYTNGTGADSGPIAGWVQTFADEMGWDDVVESGVGSTGYLAAPGGGLVKLRDRAANDILGVLPDLCIVTMGHNDTSFDATSLQTEVATVLALIKDAGIPVWVTGPLFQGGLQSTYTAVQAAIFAGAAGIADLTVDTTTTPWFTGTGHVGATTGTGNSDLGISSDSVHPNDVGHAYLARRMAEACSAQLAA